jgi:hypothetical protein
MLIRSSINNLSPATGTARGEALSHQLRLREAASRKQHLEHLAHLRMMQCSVQAQGKIIPVSDPSTLEQNIKGKNDERPEAECGC